VKIIFSWTTTIVFALAALAIAGVPQTINYQGYLKNGTVPASSPTSMTFSLYSTSNGAGAVWNSTSLVGARISVTPINGVYSVELGATPQPALPAFDRQYWLGVQAENEQEMRPLQPLTSVPYALRAGTAGSSSSTDALSGTAINQLDSRYVDPTLPPRPTTQQIVQQQWNQIAPTQVQFTNGSNPSALAFDGSNIWAAFAGNGTDPGSVQRINPGNGALVGSPISVGNNPKALVYDGSHIWVANKGSNTVTKINATNGTVIGTYTTTAAGPQALVYDGTFIWVANGTGNNIVRLIPSSGAMFDISIAAGTNPSALAYDGTNIWVANKGSNTVTKITAATGNVVIPAQAISVGTGPTALAFDGGNYIHVLNSGDNTLYSCNTGGTSCSYAGAVPANSSTMIFDGKSLWVGGQNDMSKYDTNSQLIGQVSSATFYISALLYDGRNLWSANNGYGVISKWENAGVSIGIASVGNQQIQDGSITSNKIAGTLADSSLSSNVALLGADQTFNGTNTFNTAPTFISDTGMPPFAVTSNGVVTNLNADYLDNQHASDFAAATHSHAYTPTDAVFLGTDPPPITHYSDTSFVLESLDANTIRLRSVGADFMQWSMIYPTNCSGVAEVGSATMASVFRFTSVSNISLPATFCAEVEGSMMLINVSVVGKEERSFTCWKGFSNSNKCLRMN